MLNDISHVDPARMRISKITWLSFIFESKTTFKLGYIYLEKKQRLNFNEPFIIICSVRIHLTFLMFNCFVLYKNNLHI